MDGISVKPYKVAVNENKDDPDGADLRRSDETALLASGRSNEFRVCRQFSHFTSSHLTSSHFSHLNAGREVSYF